MLSICIYKVKVRAISILNTLKRKHCMAALSGELTDWETLYVLKAYIVHLHKTFRGNCVKQHEKSYP